MIVQFLTLSLAPEILEKVFSLEALDLCGLQHFLACFNPCGGRDA